MTGDELRAAAERGEAYQAGEAAVEPLVYEMGDVACSLTLDRQQAWVLMVLLRPYSDAEQGDWETLRAASDIYRRLAEIVN